MKVLKTFMKFMNVKLYDFKSNNLNWVKLTKDYQPFNILLEGHIYCPFKK